MGMKTGKVSTHIVTYLVRGIGRKAIALCTMQNGVYGGGRLSARHGRQTASARPQSGSIGKIDIQNNGMGVILHPFELTGGGWAQLHQRMIWKILQ